jgi:hypothetical protein
MTKKRLYVHYMPHCCKILYLMTYIQTNSAILYTFKYKKLCQTSQNVRVKIAH